MHSIHNMFEEETNHSAASTRHMICDPWLCSSCQCETSYSPCLCSCLKQLTDLGTHTAPAAWLEQKTWKRHLEWHSTGNFISGCASQYRCPSSDNPAGINIPTFSYVMTDHIWFPSLPSFLTIPCCIGKGFLKRVVTLLLHILMILTMH